MPHDLVVERDWRILTIVFDRPDARNALDRQTRVALVERLQHAEEDGTIRVVILTGTDPAFSSGIDIKELRGDADYVPPPIDPATQARRMTTPTIAAVNGACVTGALEIMLGCSMAIASERAIFADTHTKVGLTPGWGLSAHLPAAIGHARANQLSLTGTPIDAVTALAWGLVNEVVAHDELLPRARELAAQIVAIPARSVRRTLTLARDGRDLTLDPLRELERDVLRAGRAATERSTDV